MYWNLTFNGNFNERLLVNNPRKPGFYMLPKTHKVDTPSSPCAHVQLKTYPAFWTPSSNILYNLFHPILRTAQKLSSSFRALISSLAMSSPWMLLPFTLTSPTMMAFLPFRSFSTGGQTQTHLLIPSFVWSNLFSLWTHFMAPFTGKQVVSP